MQHQSLESHTVVVDVQLVVFGQPVVLMQQLVLILWLRQGLLRAMTHGHPIASSRRSKILTNGSQLENRREASRLKLKLWTTYWSLMTISLLWGGNISFYNVTYFQHMLNITMLKNNHFSLVCNLIQILNLIHRSQRVTRSGSGGSDRSAPDTRPPTSTTQPTSATTSRKRKRSSPVQRADTDPESR